MRKSIIAVGILLMLLPVCASAQTKWWDIRRFKIGMKPAEIERSAGFKVIVNNNAARVVQSVDGLLLSWRFLFDEKNCLKGLRIKAKAKFKNIQHAVLATYGPSQGSTLEMKWTIKGVEYQFLMFTDDNTGESLVVMKKGNISLF